MGHGLRCELLGLRQLPPQGQVHRPALESQLPGIHRRDLLRRDAVPAHRRHEFHHHPGSRWQWFGGLLGAIYIGGIVLIVPQIGTGGAIVTSLLGLLVGSLLIDQFGLLGTNKKPISAIQIVGLLVLLAGVVIIQISK